jgi:hypothetical protein
MNLSHARTSGSHEGAADAQAAPAGLQPSAHGYTLESAQLTLPSQPVTFRFGIRGPDGALVREFNTRHERELHVRCASRRPAVAP